MRIEVDNHKLMYHPKRVHEWMEKGDCFPIYAEMGLTNFCNNRCIFCALDFLDKKGNFIDKEVMLRNLDNMSQNGLKSVMFAGEGEPLLHKEVGLFTQRAKENSLGVSITTNGNLFTKEKREQCLPNLSWIRFSVDSGSPENYSKIHGTNPENFERVIKNIEESVKLKNKDNLDVTIGVQFLMIPQNINETTKLAKRLKNIGADNLQIKPYSHHPLSKNNFIVNPEKYNSLEKDLMKYNSEDFKIFFRKATFERIQEGINYQQCYGLSFFILTDAKGNVIPCNLFYDKPEFKYGNLYENLFSDIWKGKRRKEIIRKINEHGLDDCRAGCRLDVINRYLDRLRNPEPHDNFI